MSSEPNYFSQDAIAARIAAGQPGLPDGYVLDDPVGSGNVYITFDRLHGKERPIVQVNQRSPRDPLGRCEWVKRAATPEQVEKFGIRDIYGKVLSRSWAGFLNDALKPAILTEGAVQSTADRVLGISRTALQQQGAPQLGDLWPSPADSTVPLVSVEWPCAGGERCPCVKAYQQEANGSMGWRWRAATPEQAAAAGFTAAAAAMPSEQGSQHATSPSPPAPARVQRSAADIEAEQAQQIADRILGNEDAAACNSERPLGASAPSRRNAELSGQEGQAISDRILAAESDDDEESPDAVARRILDS